MIIYPRILSTAAAIAATCVISAAAYYYKSRKPELNEVMIFCKLHYNVYNCFDKLMGFMEAAKQSVNVCMPGIHNPAIQGRLVEVIKKNNIKVRIILDHAGFQESTDFLMQELKDVGAEIKCISKDSQQKMQHKFCLIDDEVLMTGTLNWGNDRSSDHWNYVYITNKAQLVEPVKKGFYHMWHESFNVIEIMDDKHNCSTKTANIYEDCHFVDKTELDPMRAKSLTPELSLV